MAHKISVALCTYNGEKYLSEQLASLSIQDRVIDELVIVDDASTDLTPKILLDFMPTAPMPIQFYSNQSRLGPTKNFQEAIRRCTGDIIFLCDQDDHWHPNKIRRFLREFENDQIALAFSDAKIIRADGSPTGKKFWHSIWFTPAEQSRIRAGDPVPVLLRHSIAAGSMLAFRSKYLPLLLPFPDLPRSHDIWITLLIAAVAKISPIPEPLIDYRIHPDNQIGLPQNGLTGQIASARRQIQQNAFALAADFYQSALNRLTANHAPDAVLQLIAQKVHHSRARHDLPHFPAKLGVIAKEWKSGNYKKYSYGFKSVLQDLFLR
jgi:glycosyltransferase involved in cell wall biosynthesis